MFGIVGAWALRRTIDVPFITLPMIFAGSHYKFLYRNCMKHTAMMLLVVEGSSEDKDLGSRLAARFGQRSCGSVLAGPRALVLKTPQQWAAKLNLLQYDCGWRPEIL